MNRREAIQYFVLGASSCLTYGYFEKTGNAVTTISEDNQQNYDYILLYWMPYDNDLSIFAPPIIRMLSKGVQSDKVLVVVQSDLSGAKQLSRTIIRKGNIQVQAVETADSSSEIALNDYLNWARLQFEAKHWVIIFLGHGGRLMEISPDENTNPSLSLTSETKWMNLYKVSKVIDQFNQAINNKLELLFFQNCNRGNIEIHYIFQNAAKYTLSSQVTLGTPNYYYESLLKNLSNNPNLNGGQIAEKIMDFERLDMYHSLTLTRNPYFQQLPQILNPVIDSILMGNTDAVKKSIHSSLLSKTNSSFEVYFYEGERFVDFGNFLQEVTSLSGADLTAFNHFLTFLNNVIIQKVQKNGELHSPRIQRQYQKCSGLGLFFPRNRQELESYKDLKVYSDLKLVNLFNAILFDD